MMEKKKTVIRKKKVKSSAPPKKKAVVRKKVSAKKAAAMPKKIPEHASVPVWKMDENELKWHRFKQVFNVGAGKKAKPYNSGKTETLRDYEDASKVRHVSAWQDSDDTGSHRTRVRRERKPLSLKTKVNLIILFSVVAILAIAYAYIVNTYTIKTVYVQGNSHYTDQQIIDKVMTGRWEHNSLYLNFAYHHKEIQNIPFVSALEVSIVKPDTVEITVYEKSLAGYVSYLGRYMYFDKDGNVVESSQEATKGIPLVTGLTFDHVVMYEKLPIKDGKIFSEILDITQFLTKYSLEADKIYFDEDSKVTLYFGNVRVKIGNDDNIDDKLSQMQAILPKLEGKKGVLQLENYTSDTKTVTFQSDEELSNDDLSGNNQTTASTKPVEEGPIQ